MDVTLTVAEESMDWIDRQMLCTLSAGDQSLPRMLRQM